MSDWSVHGPIESMEPWEIKRAITRTIELAADARRYSGPNGAAMYERSLRDLYRELAKRQREGAA